MFQKFREKTKLKGISQHLYSSIVAQARQKVFYLDLGVPDTVEGRYELISLHLFLLLHVWKKDFGPEDELGKSVLELFFSELDGSLREMGISDLKVPQKMRKLADGFYVRLYNYSKAVEDENPDVLNQALLDNLYQAATIDTEQNADSAIKTHKMARYIRRNIESLQNVADKDLRDGILLFLAPE